MTGTDSYYELLPCKNAHPSIKALSRKEIQTRCQSLTGAFTAAHMPEWLFMVLYYFGWLEPGTLHEVVEELFFGMDFQIDPYDTKRSKAAIYRAYERMLEGLEPRDYKTIRLKAHLSVIPAEKRTFLERAINLGHFPAYNARSPHLFQLPPYKYLAPAGRSMPHSYYYKNLEIKPYHLVWRQDLKTYWDAYDNLVKRYGPGSLAIKSNDELLAHMPRIPVYRFDSIARQIRTRLRRSPLADIELQYMLYKNPMESRKSDKNKARN